MVKKFGWSKFEKSNIVGTWNNVSAGQSHGLIEFNEVDAEIEIPKCECAIVARKISTKQERNISGNMKEYFLHAVRRFEAGFATGTEKFNCNFKCDNTNMASDISSRMTSEFASKFQIETQ